MSTVNDRDRDLMRRLVQGRDAEIDLLIEQTEQSIVNTRQFLDYLSKSENKSRTYVQKIADELEAKLRRLQDQSDDDGHH